MDKNMVCANFAHTTQHGAIEGNTSRRVWKVNFIENN